MFLNYGADRLRSAEDVHVQVLDFLLTDFAGIDDDAEARRTALCQRDFMRFGEHLPKEGCIVGADGGQRSDVFFRDDQNVYRALRGDVLEGEQLLVLVHPGGGNCSGSDLAENTVAHFRALRAAFSSMPEMPSRRRISCDTSSMLMSKKTSSTRMW